MKRFVCIGMVAALASVALSSCMKEYNPKDYAPKKPLPSFDGFANSKDIEPASLVAIWPFSGSLTDSISNATATNSGTSFTGGVSGQGLQGAANSYAVANTSAAIKGLHSFTISTWVNMPQNTNALGVLSIANGQTFWGNLDIFFDTGDANTATSGNLKVHMWNNSASTTGTDAWEGGYTVDNPWNKWIQILVTYDDAAGKISVYYNGKVAGTNTQAGFAPLDWSQANQIVFGTMQFQTTPSLTSATGAQDWAGYLTGKLDQVRVYNKVLTDDQIDALYNLEKAGR